MPTGINRAISDKGIASHHNLVMSETFVSSTLLHLSSCFYFLLLSLILESVMTMMIKPVSLAVLGGLLAMAGPVMADTIKLRIVETTDIHTNLMDYDYYKDKASDQIGLTRAATLVKQARAEVENSVLVDNGDLIQGSPMGDYMAAKGIKAGEVHPVYKAMNPLGYDVGNIGNHEFNYGLEF